jgi:IS30 family transposase
VGELGSSIRQIAKAIAEHRQEIARLESELQDAREALAATSTKRASKGRHIEQRRRPIKDKSNVGWARSILRHHEKPMHIDSLLKAIEEMSGFTVRKTTLVSNLSRYVRAGDTFTRPEPSMYGLTDWKEVA